MGGRRRPPVRRTNRHARSPFLRTLSTPIGRWGFTVLAVMALLNDMAEAALFAGALAALAWRNR
jgi:hypothetical protein